MSKKLPANPHLRQIGNQAKDLVKAQRRGDSDAALRMGQYLLRMTVEEIAPLLTAISD